jgi:uncharacterized membrane protein YsdA (DUF1294 family)
LLDLLAIFSIDNILRWIIVAGILGFILMAYDKAKSGLKRRRTQERNLWLVALVGGFLGVVAGAVVFRHKISKASFWPPVLAAMALWLCLISVMIF